MERIYLDYNASTPVDPKVLEVMLPYFTQEFGNPSSQTHSFGWAAQMAVQKARNQVANLIGAKAVEVVFTSGATESNSLAILGTIEAFKKSNPGKKIHVLTSAAEHNSVLESCRQIIEQGVEVEFLPVNSYGQIELETLRAAIKPETRLMSFIWANNEVGSINPIAEIGKLAKEKNILLHVDGTQACGKFPVNVNDANIDLLSLSGHKMYGPKGVGALYIRAQNPRVELIPQIRGGGQERGFRSGTLNVPGIVGLGAACSVAQTLVESEGERLKDLASEFFSGLKRAFPDVELNGHPTERIPGQLSLYIPGIKAASLLPRMSQLAMSATSACSSGSGHASHVLKAMGLSERADHSLRMSFGRQSSPQTMSRALEILIASLPKDKSPELGPNLTPA